MILVVALFGHEVVRLELGAPTADDEGGSVDEPTVTHRHAGDFGFGPLPGPPGSWLPSDIEA